jgi:membrane-associated PAP2 superfamily phosphatase
MTREFWLTHAALPGAAFLLAMAIITTLQLDTRVANAFFFDPVTATWLGAHTRWAEAGIHTGGRDLVRAVALGGALLLLSSRHRRSAAFVLLAIALSTGVTGLLKHLTNVDCPWSLTGFGGDRPYVALFADRPDWLPPAACFPGAHSSSGFALICFYFLFRDQSRRAARTALAGALALGTLFAFGQESRGAHFLSHDLTSLAVVWYVQLGLYLRYAAARPAIDSALHSRLTL